MGALFDRYVRLSEGLIYEQDAYGRRPGCDPDLIAHGLEPVTEIVLEAPAGLIAVRAEVANGKVKSVMFRNVPAFAVHLDVPLEVRRLGTLTVDVAYGGMFYVIADAPSLGLRLTPDEGREIVRRSFAPTVYEPQDAALWREARERFVKAVALPTLEVGA